MAVSLSKLELEVLNEIRKAHSQLEHINVNKEMMLSAANFAKQILKREVSSMSAGIQERKEAVHAEMYEEISFVAPPNAESEKMSDPIISKLKLNPKFANIASMDNIGFSLIHLADGKTISCFFFAKNGSGSRSSDALKSILETVPSSFDANTLMSKVNQFRHGMGFSDLLLEETIQKYILTMVNQLRNLPPNICPTLAQNVKYQFDETLAIALVTLGNSSMNSRDLLQSLFTNDQFLKIILDKSIQCLAITNFSSNSGQSIVYVVGANVPKVHQRLNSISCSSTISTSSPSFDIDDDNDDFSDLPTAKKASTPIALSPRTALRIVAPMPKQMSQPANLDFLDDDDDFD